jgi:hypothetical protein
VELLSHLVTFPIPLPSSRRGEFDNIATNLWNLSTRLLRSVEASEQTGAGAAAVDKKPLCLLRVFSCYLLDAAHQPQDNQEDQRRAAGWENNSVRLLKVFLKATKSCTRYGVVDWATKMLERAAAFVGQLIGRVTGEDGELVERLKNQFLVMRVMLVCESEFLLPKY